LNLKDMLRLEVWRSYFIHDDMSYEEMRNALDQILKRWPDDLETYKDGCDYSENTWNVTVAARYAERGLEYFPDDYELRVSFVDMLLASEERERALLESWKNVELFPDDKYSWALMGNVYLAIAEPDSSEWAFNKALEIDAVYNPSLLGLVYSNYHRGEVNRAIDMLERLIDSDQLEPVTRRRKQHVMEREPSLAMLYSEIGMFEDALKVTEKAYSLVDSSKFYMMDWHKMLLLRAAGRDEEVLELSQKCIEREQGPDWLNGHLTRAMILVDMDSLESAEKVLDALYRELEINEHYYIRARLPYLEAQMDILRGDPAAAINRLNERGIYWVLTMTAIHHMEILAEAHEIMGDLASARKVQKELLRVFGGHAVSHYELGKLYEKSKMPEEAKRHYEKFLEMWKNADEGLPELDYTRKRLEILIGA
jgi:tetratricopeptide (TPR) repeat protein